MPTSILKGNAETFAPLIMKIVNASLQSGTVPADMKHALVTPLHKRHGLDTNNLANYRPVSNIGFVSKVLERYVANAVREHIDNNGYNDAFQSAYRPRHSTETALVRIHNDLMQSMYCRRGVLLVLLDLSAAFDTLDHGILLRRLHEIGVRHTVLEWFKSYVLSHVRTNNKSPPTYFELDSTSCRAAKGLSVDTNRVSLRQLLAAQ